MKRILLLFSKQSFLDKKTDPERLAGLLNKTNKGAFDYAFLEDITYFVSPENIELINSRNNQKLESYDAVYIRYIGYLEAQAPGLGIARYCSIKNIPFIDRELLRPGSFNKINQYINLFEAGVSFPKTFIAKNDRIAEGIKQYGFTFPFILKGASGTRGQDNFLVKNEDELAKIIAEPSKGYYVLQEFIPNEGDYRILVCGDDVKLVIKRMASEGTHLNNTSQGGNAVIVENSSIAPEILADSVKAAQFYGRDFAGVDMVVSKTTGQHYCFEVNRAPQIENSSFEDEKAAFVAEYLVSLTAE
jgi:glutathione synthase/RimK-type ligase-like ATP-grasp enzyme